MLLPEHIRDLKNFVQLVSANPDILHNTPELGFFKNFIESFGGKVPPPRPPSPKAKPATENVKVETPKEEDTFDFEESDVELDATGVIEPDVLIGEQEIKIEPGKEAGESDIEKANEIRSQAVGAFNDGDFDEAVRLYTDSIKHNPGMALLYAKRGQAYLMLGKPNACIRDCTAALSLNPDNAVAYKFRGRARRLLGQWLDAAKDLRNACKLDCDEQAEEWLKEVTPNARKLEEHERKYERLRADKEFARRRKAREAAHTTKAASASATSAPTGTPSTEDFGAFASIFSDPEIQEAMSDPEVARILELLKTNPSRMMEYKDNPKVMKLFSMMANKMQGSGGVDPMNFGNMFNMPSFDAGIPKNDANPTLDEVD